MSQFDAYDKNTHPDRLKRIYHVTYEERKQQFPNNKNKWGSYIDDGCVALYHCLLQAHNKGFHHTVEFALRELEKLYNLK